MEDNGRFIRTLFRKHASLNVLSLLTSTIGPIVCNMLAGTWYGSDGLAIASLCSPLFFLAGFFGFVISGGASVLAAKAIARDESDEVNAIYSAAAVLSLLMGLIVFGGLFLFRHEVVRLLAGDGGPDIMSYYICIVIYGFITVSLYLPLYFSRVTGQNKIGVLLTATMTVITLIAVPILKPFFGLSAIALGQAIGTVTATVLCMFLLRKKLRFVFPRKLYIRQIAATGSPMGLSRLYTFIGSFMLNSLFLKAGGTEAVAAYGVVSTLNRFITSATGGLSQTMVPLAGVFNEEQDTTSARQLTKTAFIYGNAVMIAVLVLILILNNPLSVLFGLASGALLVPLLFNSAYAILNLNSTLFTAYYNASGRLLIANAVPFSQDFALLLLLAALLGKTVSGVWSALPLAYLAGAAVVALFVFLYSKKNTGLSFPLLIDSKREREARYISFSVEGGPSDAGIASGKIAEFCEEQEMPPKQTMLISMAIEEMLTLIMQQCTGYSSISVRLYFLEGTTILRIRNAGTRFDPITYYKDNISEDIEKSLDIIGLKYVVESAEVVYYTQTFGINNSVVIM